MLRNNRVILSKNGTLTDLSVNASNFLSGTNVINIVAATDKLYLGSDLPFNHRWFEVSVVNALASVPSVKLWNGSEWKAAVDVVDETQSTSGKVFSQSGIISWSPDRDEASWVRQQSTEDIAALTSLRIYDAYWAEMSFSGDLTGTTALGYVGHKFSKDENLFSQYPELENSTLMTAFKAGKTTWNDQTFEAAEYIIQELRSKGVVFSKNQILDWSIFKNASVHKTAEIAFRAFGDDYSDNLMQAKKDFKEAMDLKAFNVDQNANAVQEEKERLRITDYLTR